MAGRSRAAEAVPLRPLLVSLGPRARGMRTGAGLQGRAAQSELLRGQEGGRPPTPSSLWPTAGGPSHRPASALRAHLLPPRKLLLASSAQPREPATFCPTAPPLGSLSPGRSAWLCATSGSFGCQASWLRQRPQFPGCSQLPLLPRWRAPGPPPNSQMSPHALSPQRRLPYFLSPRQSGLGLDLVAIRLQHPAQSRVNKSRQNNSWTAGAGARGLCRSRAHSDIFFKIKTLYLQIIQNKAQDKLLCRGRDGPYNNPPPHPRITYIKN